MSFIVVLVWNWLLDRKCGGKILGFRRKVKVPGIVFMTQKKLLRLVDVLSDFHAACKFQNFDKLKIPTRRFFGFKSKRKLDLSSKTTSQPSFLLHAPLTLRRCLSRSSVTPVAKPFLSRRVYSHSFHPSIPSHCFDITSRGARKLKAGEEKLKPQPQLRLFSFSTGIIYDSSASLFPLSETCSSC
jgi:hypothetical protein